VGRVERMYGFRVSKGRSNGAKEMDEMKEKERMTGRVGGMRDEG